MHKTHVSEINIQTSDIYLYAQNTCVQNEYSNSICVTSSFYAPLHVYASYVYRVAKTHRMSSYVILRKRAL